MRKPLVSALLLAAGAAIAVGGWGGGAIASSHREAPLISLDPTADNTDVYAFVSQDRPDSVTFVANYIPLEEPAGGPNFNAFDPNVRYEINIDNTGDGREDIAYQFNFRNVTRNPNTFLYNTGQITSLDDPDWNQPQFYNVTRIDYKDGRARDRKVLGRDLPTPPVNIGPRSTPNYEQLAAMAARDLPNGIKVFAGQRDDPFYVDLGSVFDLLGLRPFNPAHLIPLDQQPGVDGVGGFNTHSIVLQVPIDQLTRTGKRPADATDSAATLGIYASASRPSVKVLRSDGSQQSFGNMVQVSRLANPLINEVLIPLGRKDYWNAQSPANDAQFVNSYRKPELAGLINLLYPALPDTRTDNRDDLVAILLTGVKGLNFTGDTKADLLRLNTGIAATAPVGQGNVMGVLAGDLAGFPNGRRLEDDVTDIELRAVADGYGKVLNDLLGLPNQSPNNTVGDGVNSNDKPFLPMFPYVGTPHQGYEHSHHRVGSTNTPPIPVQ